MCALHFELCPILYCTRFYFIYFHFMCYFFWLFHLHIAKFKHKSFIFVNEFLNAVKMRISLASLRLFRRHNITTKPKQTHKHFDMCIVSIAILSIGHQTQHAMHYRYYDVRCEIRHSIIRTVTAGWKGAKLNIWL